MSSNTTPPNNSLKLTRRAGPWWELVFAARLS
jgi:hypothetical protein